MPGRHANRLIEVIAQLEALYGAPEAPAMTDPFELIVWENVAYLVNDERRSLVFERLRTQVGITPEAVLAAAPGELAMIIQDGGMQPDRRAEKLRTSAQIALEVGLPELDRMMRVSPAKAKRVLMRFPGIGEPSADKILLYAGAQRSLGLESNGLRALVRLGLAEVDANYTRMYRQASQALAPMLPTDFPWLVRAHLLLRTHGQELCKRTAPRCAACPLTTQCSWYQSQNQS